MSFCSAALLPLLCPLILLSALSFSNTDISLALLFTLFKLLDFRKESSLTARPSWALYCKLLIIMGDDCFIHCIHLSFQDSLLLFGKRTQNVHKWIFENSTFPINTTIRRLNKYITYPEEVLHYQNSATLKTSHINNTEHHINTWKNSTLVSKRK